ncbi:hypothetical protein BN381_80198 [Candidatus Microthrix parvicella RN1]|uniref:Uncharacterized protein n=1 Tax=Candidatus Neomicrothrix parvicella RN1 TaxID=1229780 RepID=R4Z4K7_9ACTN|nr:hypothetical protein BN381_80198 [Candidatus Microthrix parvicella RN1]
MSWRLPQNVSTRCRYPPAPTRAGVTRALPAGGVEVRAAAEPAYVPVTFSKRACTGDGTVVVA